MLILECESESFTCESEIFLRKCSAFMLFTHSYIRKSRFSPINVQHSCFLMILTFENRQKIDFHWVFLKKISLPHSFGRHFRAFCGYFHLKMCLKRGIILLSQPKLGPKCIYIDMFSSWNINISVSLFLNGVFFL
jgi:hypothetical protein